MKKLWLVGLLLLVGCSGVAEAENSSGECFDNIAAARYADEATEHLTQAQSYTEVFDVTSAVDEIRAAASAERSIARLVPDEEISAVVDEAAMYLELSADSLESMDVDGAVTYMTRSYKLIQQATTLTQAYDGEIC